jgi:hypothetical protein
MATDPNDLRNWTVRDLLTVARAAGMLWDSHPFDALDVLSDRQRALLARAASSYLPADQGAVPDEDDEDEAIPQSWDGWVTLDNDRYYVMLEGLRAGPELGVPRRNMAIYELAKAMSDRGSFPAAWITGEHGPASESIDAEVRAWHDAGGDGLLPLTGTHFAPGDIITAHGTVPWAVAADYGNMGVLLYAPGDPTVTMTADHQAHQLAYPADEPVPGEEYENDHDEDDEDPDAESLLPTNETMNPARPEDAVYFDRNQVAYVVALEGNPSVLRVLTSFGSLRGWDIGSVHTIRHDQTWHPLGTWRVAGIRNHRSGNVIGSIPSRPLRHWVFK